MNKPLGTKWFTFYTKVRPCISCVTGFSLIIDFIQYSDLYSSNGWLIFLFLIQIVQPVLDIIVMIKSYGNYIDFFRFVKGVLLFETISIPLSNATTQYILSRFNIYVALIVFAVMFVIAFFLWYRLNVKYFEKRIYLFANDSPKDGFSHITECHFCGYRDNKFFDPCPICGKYAAEYVDSNRKNTSELNKVRYCRKCGEKLIENSRFCRKCGTEIVEVPNDVTYTESQNFELCKKCGADISHDIDACHICGESKGVNQQ